MPLEKQAAGEGYYLGFDGGGTKTDCILVDAAGAVLARATAGPSNPPRARVVTLQEKPVEAAAQLAIRLGRRKAHAG